MADQETPATRKSSPWRILAVLVLLLLVYQGVMWGVRAHVNGEIQKSVGLELFEFSLEDLDGKTWTSADLVGKKVVLNFFRSYCSGCSLEAPNVRRLVQQVDPAEVIVLGVMMDEVQGFPAEATQRTLTDYGFVHPVLMADQKFLDAFHGAGWSHVTPITYYADGSGKITAALRGHQTFEALLAPLR